MGHPTFSTVCFGVKFVRRFTKYTLMLISTFLSSFSKNEFYNLDTFTPIVEVTTGRFRPQNFVAFNKFSTRIDSGKSNVRLAC